MTKKKKIILSLIAALILGIGLFISAPYILLAYIFGTDVPNHVAKNYVEEKYGFEIDIIEKNTYGISAPTEFTVSPEKNKDIRFTVIVDSFNHEEIEDDYHVAIEIDKEFQKLKTVIPAIEKLRFRGADNSEIRISYIGDSAYLYLESETAINYDTFVKEDLDRFYTLYKLMKKSKANISDVTVGNSVEHDNTQSGISFYVEPPDKTKTKTKEEFLTLLKANHKEFAESEVQTRLKEETDKLANERFSFGNQYGITNGDSPEPWFYCQTVDEKGDCTNAVLSITYQEDSFNLGNPHLKEDLTSIFNFIETHLEPKTKIEYIYLDGSNLSNDNLDIGYDQRIKYKDAQDLINTLLK